MSKKKRPAALSGDMTDASPSMSAIAAQTDALSPARLQSPQPHQHLRKPPQENLRAANPAIAKVSVTPSE